MEASPWIALVERLGITGAVLFVLGVFFIKYVWPFLQQQMLESVANLKEQNEHWRDELKESRAVYLMASRTTEDNINKIVERHEKFAERHEKALDRLADSIKSLHCSQNGRPQA